jgi:SAM-dependent methyltransferase
MSEESHYLHGTSLDEQRRLAKLNELINANSLREMALIPGESVLDVGSGLGQLTRDIARQVGAKVVGIERSEEQIRECLRFAVQAGETNLAEFRQGDAAAPPLAADEWGTFDVAHTRFVLEHVRDPLAVVRQMFRALRPGGRIILEDDGHDIFRIWPQSPGFDQLWKNYIRTYDRVGNDPLIGHRLVALLHEAGAIPMRNTWLFFGACAGQGELFGAYVANIIAIFQGVRDEILNLGEFDGDSFDSTIKQFRDWSKRPDASLWYAISWAEGRRPAVSG